jgi:serpin B
MLAIALSVAVCAVKSSMALAQDQSADPAQPANPAPTDKESDPILEYSRVIPMPVASVAATVEAAASLIATTEDDPVSAKAAQGANDFALKLAAALAEESKGQNFIISPFSVWLPLAALVNATKESEREALLSALSEGGISPGDLNKAASRLLYGLTDALMAELNPDHKNPLKIANAVFVDSARTINQDFAQKFMDFYRGGSVSADFKSGEAVKTVNDWVSGHTEGKIPSIASEFTPDTVAVIANAIYMASPWRDKFSAERTKPGTFRTPKGEIQVPLMEAKRFYPYYEDDSLQAVSIKLASSGALLVVLPKKGDPYSTLGSLTSAKLQEMAGAFETREGRVVLPRFKIESEPLELAPVLAKMGVRLFDPSLALLTGGLLEGEEPVFLSKAIHKALIEVDEEGMTAAAATIMVAVTRALLPQGEPFEFVCDKPFLVIAYGHPRDNPIQALFVGIVNDPSGK